MAAKVDDRCQAVQQAWAECLLNEAPPDMSTEFLDKRVTANTISSLLCTSWTLLFARVGPDEPPSSDSDTHTLLLTALQQASWRQTDLAWVALLALFVRQIAGRLYESEGFQPSR